MREDVTYVTSSLIGWDLVEAVGFSTQSPSNTEMAPMGCHHHVLPSVSSMPCNVDPLMIWMFMATRVSALYGMYFLEASGSFCGWFADGYNCNLGLSWFLVNGTSDENISHKNNNIKEKIKTKQMWIECMDWKHNLQVVIVLISQFTSSISLFTWKMGFFFLFFV